MSFLEKLKLKENIFISKTIVMSCLHMSFICVVLIPFFKENKINAIQISFLLSSRKIAKVILDIPAGILFDIFNAKIIFFISRILKIICLLLLLKEKSMLFLMLSMILDGITYSMFYTKIGAYVYNQMSNFHLTNKYTQYMSIYYLLANVYISAITLISGIIMLQYNNFRILIYISVAITTISLLIFPFIPQATINKKGDKMNLKKIILEMKIIIENRPIFFYVLLIYGISNFLTWQSGTFCSLILLDMGFNASQVAFMGAIQKIIISFGTLLPIFWFKGGISIRASTINVLLTIIFMVIATITYNKILFVIFSISTMVVYALTETSLENQFDKASNGTIRGTVTSIGWFFCNIITIITTMTLGIVAQYASYKLASQIISISLLCFVLLIFKSLANNNFKIYN